MTNTTTRSPQELRAELEVRKVAQNSVRNELKTMNNKLEAEILALKAHYAEKIQATRTALNENNTAIYRLEQELDRVTPYIPTVRADVLPNQKVIAFTSPVHARLFEQEIKGQISDGHWENSGPRDHWVAWCDAVAIVDAANPGRNFYALKDNYNLNASLLLEAVGDRMVEDIRNKFNRPEYSLKDLKADLKEMKAAFRIQTGWSA